MATSIRYLTMDPRSRAVLISCPGPAETGACRRVSVGEPVACAGHDLLREGSAAPYPVPPTMTLCPVTLAVSMGAATDLIPPEAPA